MPRVTRRILSILLLIPLAGCGGGEKNPPHRAPAPSHGRELVYMSRNVESAIPEDVVVFADGTVHYRYLLHTKITQKVRTDRLAPGALARLRTLIAHTRMDGAQRLGVQPRPRGAFWYLLRIDGRSITTADGHLTSGVRPLIRVLGRLETRMLLRGGG
jgi:hypothetical protein